MAVAPTGAIYKAMTIDGESSRTYGVYITGQAVYNAPQREVEMISIAGRNGQFALDKGRFENIEVTYPAGIYAETEEDFAEAVSNFRNFLCSRDGYVRIEDEYNPNEYRMGVYKSGLEVTPKLLKAGEFDITFDCKPQRWLKSGENAITVASGDVVTNPTLFESSPILEAEGYGTIGFNGYEIDLSAGTLGEIVIAPASTGRGTGTHGSAQFTVATDIPSSSFARGDTFTIDPSTFIVREISARDDTSLSVVSNSLSGATTEITSTTGLAKYYTFAFNFPAITFDVFTSSYITSVENIVTLRTGAGGTITITARVSYYRGDKIMATMSVNTDYFNFYPDSTNTTSSVGRIYGDSSLSMLGNPTYIDCDLGECYKYESGEVISLNRYIDLGSDLPKLSSGANTITFDNTITDLKIIPRWWKV